MRESGILMPISSLASRFGIGCFSREAYEFVDFLQQSGQGYWQILPIGHNGYGDSPYQPVSAYAGNPYFIDPEALIQEGLLTEQECCEVPFGSDEEQIDYGLMYEGRFALLEKAFERFGQKGEPAQYREFCSKNAAWLSDYALYMALKKAHNGAGWEGFEPGYQKREAPALCAFRTEHKRDIDFYCFIQFEFYSQWEKLRTYANKKNIKIIGDMPFYMAMDSVDVWVHPEAFHIDRDMKPILVAGTPPDDFSPEGQRWGNPLYDWEALKGKGYGWWIDRILHNYELFDVVRIDHFHGFTEYYGIPFDEEDAAKGEAHKGPGMDFFKALYRKIGEPCNDKKLTMIAEDLGTITDENTALLRESGIPGMQVLQYAFTGWDSIYLPYKHKEGTVCYTGTHDNTTLRAYLEEVNEGSLGYIRRYLNSMNTDFGGLVWDFIREAYRSPSMLCIVPLQDYLVKGREARINEPGTFGNNWKWRLKPHFLSGDLAGSIRGLVETYGRVPGVAKEPDKDEEDSKDIDG